MKPILLMAALTLALFGTISWSAGAAPERVETIATRPGVTISFVVAEPWETPKAGVILFAGGSGKVKLWRRKPPRLGNNFLVRSRQLFAARGFYTLVVDVASDQRRDGLLEIRHGRQHRTDMEAIMKWLRARVKAPLWLIGTSRGTVSVLHLAANTRIDGAVLTATVTSTSNRSLATALDAKLEDITVPVLLVNHLHDGCHVTPANNLYLLSDRLQKSSRVETLLFSGGHQQDDNPCKAMTHHGFLGIEKKVIGAIADWIKGSK